MIPCRSQKQVQDKTVKDLAAKAAEAESTESSLRAQISTLQRQMESMRDERKQVDGKLAQAGRDSRISGETIKVGGSY